MGKLYLVGIGPGGAEEVTPRARRALEGAQQLFAYAGYWELARAFLPGRTCITTPMTREIDRCRLALQAAQEGQTAALLCGGDAGVYGMAGPVIELSPQYPGVEIEVICGVTAANAGAARLGAPLMDDFAAISLSDRLTPWPVIEGRLRAACQGDFVLCLYNPCSSARRGRWRQAVELLRTCRPGATPCGWVRQAGREGESLGLTTLDIWPTRRWTCAPSSTWATGAPGGWGRCWSPAGGTPSHEGGLHPGRHH